MYLSSAQIKGKIKNIAKQNHSDPITYIHDGKIFRENCFFKI